MINPKIYEATQFCCLGDKKPLQKISVKSNGHEYNSTYSEFQNPLLIEVLKSERLGSIWFKVTRSGWELDRRLRYIHVW